MARPWHWHSSWARDPVRAGSASALGGLTAPELTGLRADPPSAQWWDETRPVPPHSHRPAGASQQTERSDWKIGRFGNINAMLPEVLLWVHFLCTCKNARTVIFVSNIIPACSPVELGPKVLTPFDLSPQLLTPDWARPLRKKQAYCARREEANAAQF